MNATTIIYPATPKQVDEKIILPSAAFKQEVTKVLSTIILFIVVYFALMAAAFVLAALCSYGGLMLVVAIPKLFTLMIGIGLVGLGVMVLYFLLKFIFKRNTIDRSHLIEITEDDQPQLFSFIRTLTSEIQSPFPKKIYLSPEVNACVFYDSSFWSMFFPIRKNLQIGLGLVNCVNLSEFKAILAHEFGHFSQRSMKLGSYVYNVNHVIYNMLYDNDGYGRTLESWASVSGYFAFFANMTVKIVQGIQWILQQVYTLMNRNYMSLSRQMEFHADAVAAYVSGSDHLVTSLRRLEVADTCYNRLFEHYNIWFKENIKPDNLYPQHSEVMKHFAEDHGLPTENGLPQVNANSFAHFNTSRVMVKDQWASHPSTDDREEHLKKLNIKTETVAAPAWVIFRQPEELQKLVTEKVYSGVTFEKTPQPMDINAFRQKYFSSVEKYSLNKTYKGYFNAHEIKSFNFSEIGVENYVTGASTLEDILTPSSLGLPQVIEGLRTDIQTLEAIDNGTIPITTFESGGKKYHTGDAALLIPTLRDELSRRETDLDEADKKVVSFFIQRAERHGEKEKICERYAQLFAAVKESNDDIQHCADLIRIMTPIYSQSVTLEQVVAVINQVKLKEKEIKSRIKEILANADYDPFYQEGEKKKLELYLARERAYFVQPDFNNAELAELNEAIQIYRSLVTERTFFIKKELLDWQLQFIG